MRQRRRRRRFVSYLPAPIAGVVAPQPSNARRRVRAEAIREAKRRERRNGVPAARLEEDPTDHPGFDLIRRGQGEQIERVIEVIGLPGSWRDHGVALKQTTAQRAQDLGDRYWVYVVEHAADPERVQVHAIRNPLARSDLIELDPGWVALAEGTQDGRTLPAVGRILYLGDRRIGIIETMTGDPEDRASTVVLTVRADNGASRDHTWSRSRHRVEEANSDGENDSAQDGA